MASPIPHHALSAPIAITMGDPAGIGPEIVAKAWAVRESHQLQPFFVIGNPQAIRAVWSGPIQLIDKVEDVAGCFANALPCFAISDGDTPIPGSPDAHSARLALDALETGIGIVKAGSASALVTAPVAKDNLYSIGFTHPGQTEFVAERCGISAHNAVMMLAGHDLRVVPITIHLPLAQVPTALTTDLIIARARVTARGLQNQFGIAQPRLAVAGLNPHAGENGALGDEEERIIIPAIAQLQEEGIDITGPFAADTMFHERARENYDAALCMYHDQALIPIKTLYFDEGVNMTLGLPIIRTSPDHGTAFGIAGKNMAHPGAMIAAIKMAHQAAYHRAQATAKS